MKNDIIINSEDFFNGQINDITVSIINDDFESDPDDYKINIRNKNDESIYFAVDYDLNTLYM